MKVEIPQKVGKEILKLDKNVQERILQALKKLQDDKVNFAKLTGNPARWKIRIGDYRIIFSMDETKSKASILKIGHRSKIYKQF